MVFDEITISNSVPSVDSVLITPDPAYTSSTLMATPTGWSDPDGDTEGYQWQWQIWNVDEFVDIPGANADTLDNTNFVLGDTLQVVCIPYDGTDTGDAVTDDITITAFNYDAGMDVKPGSDRNPVNLGAANGVLPVAILTTPDFDARSVDHTSLTFEGAAETHVQTRTGEVRRHEEDVDGDGDVDLLLHVRVGDTDLDASAVEGTLLGRTFDGTPIYGRDRVTMLSRGRLR